MRSVWPTTTLIFSAMIAFSAAAADSPAPEPTIEAEAPEKGRYRLSGEARIEAGPETLLAILTAFEEHCTEGCRFPLPSLDRIQIVESGDDHAITWTRIDDLMNATYFTGARISRQEGTVQLQLETPGPAKLEQLITDERPHDPFFHHQRVVWTLTPAGDGGGQPPVTTSPPGAPVPKAPESTHVQVVMEMASDKWLINLMPSKVLDGSRNYLRKVFEHLGSAGQTPETGASAPVSEGRRASESSGDPASH